MTYRDNAIDQQLDVRGSINKTDTLLPLINESSSLGEEISGQSGVLASITVGSSVVVSGLTGITDSTPGRFLTISGANTAANNGTFLIVNNPSATSVEIANPSAITDANNGAISWTERQAYSLEDDLNYTRTDRAQIKGVDYDLPVPTYIQCIDQTNPIPANLQNIAGKTTDAKAFIVNRIFTGAAVSVSDTFITLISAGNLKHADAVDITGIPVFDGYDAGNDQGTYAALNDGYGDPILVQAGPFDGYQVFGRTRAGASTSPDEVEVEFRAVAPGDDISNSVAYTWEGGQPTSLTVIYGFRQCLDGMDENALRTTLVNGLVSNADLYQTIDNILQQIGTTEDDTDLQAYLTNTTSFFPFNDLPDPLNPTVIDALNTLNEQIGDRDYDGYILTDGYTITQSLQELADAISNTNAVTRVIDRNGSLQAPGTELIIPGSLSYNNDGTGQNLWVFWRGVLRDPGTLANGDDYEETSSTSITIFRFIRAGDHINYFVAV